MEELETVRTTKKEYQIIYSDRVQMVACAVDFISCMRESGEDWRSQGMSEDEELALKSALNFLTREFDAGIVKDKRFVAVDESHVEWGGMYAESSQEGCDEDGEEESCSEGRCKVLPKSEGKREGSPAVDEKG